MARSFVAEARRRVGPKKARIRPIVERLIAEHPDARIALKFRSDIELLVSVMLSAQTTDVNVNRVTATLFEKYRRPEDYLAVPVEELERDVYATGFFRQKTKSIRGTMQRLLEDYDGQVPRRLEELVRLPGVARKTGNVVAAELGEPQGIVVDTHVRRLSAAARLHEGGRPRQDRARPAAARPTRALGRLPAPLDLARPPGLHRPSTALRGMRADRPLPVVAGIGSPREDEGGLRRPRRLRGGAPCRERGHLSQHRGLQRERARPRHEPDVEPGTRHVALTVAGREADRLRQLARRAAGRLRDARRGRPGDEADDQPVRRRESSRGTTPARRRSRGRPTRSVSPSTRRTRPFRRPARRIACPGACI